MSKRKVKKWTRYCQFNKDDRGGGMGNPALSYPLPCPRCGRDTEGRNHEGRMCGVVAIPLASGTASSAR